MKYFIFLLLILPSCFAAMATPPIEIVTASYFGTAEDDDLQGAAVAPDGSIYVTGNTGAPAKDLPGAIKPATFGATVEEPKCGHGFVAHLSADGKKLLHYAEFARGIAIFTTVQVNEKGVYVSGYASKGLEDLLKTSTGVIKEYPLAKEMEQIAADKAAGKEDKIGNRPGLGRYGAPCVLRLTKELQKIEGGTYLEGWQEVWDKNRVTKQGKEMLGPYLEYFWQPTSIALLKSGDVVVCHDGGYFRLLTDEEKKATAENPKARERIEFYDTCDWLSRFSPDLGKREWKQAIYTPATIPEVTTVEKEGWTIPHYGNPRTLRMRLDKDENIFLGGWSASATSKEPWWAPYIWKMDPKTGARISKIYEYDPMSHDDHRMGGTVADTAVITLAVDRDNNLLTSLLADGGNSVIGFSPKGDETRFGVPSKGSGFGVKLVHWWGELQHVDGKTFAGINHARIGPWGWVEDIAALPEKNVLAVGRYNSKFDFTEDAWLKETIDNPNAFLRVYSPELDLKFSTSLPGIMPFEMIPLSETRFILVGRAEKETAVTQNALIGKFIGKSDGFFLIVDWKKQP